MFLVLRILKGMGCDIVARMSRLDAPIRKVYVPAGVIHADCDSSNDARSSRFTSIRRSSDSPGFNSPDLAKPTSSFAGTSMSPGFDTYT